MIVVGALSIGGAGKTPVVEYLARRWHRSDHPLAIVGHGYRGAVRSTAWVDAPDAARFGDEAAALRRALPAAIPIAVGPDRRASVRLAAQRADLILVDDGFQDHRLPRAADLVVIDATASQRVLPAGPLREPLDALNDADLIWFHKFDQPGARPLPPQWAPQVTSRVSPTAVQLAGGQRHPAAWLAGRSIRPICGIGRPEAFLNTLRQLGARVRPGLVRADHHRFTAAELAALPSDSLWVTTAKDRERLPCDWPGVVLEVEVEVIAGHDAIDALIGRA